MTPERPTVGRIVHIIDTRHGGDLRPRAAIVTAVVPADHWEASDTYEITVTVFPAVNGALGYLDDVTPDDLWVGTVPHRSKHGERPFGIRCGPFCWDWPPRV